jgi:4-hydroxy-tetrahydrodipicolinate synthase
MYAPLARIEFAPQHTCRARCIATNMATFFKLFLIWSLLLAIFPPVSLGATGIDAAHVNFHGSICALVTPFMKDFEIDWDAFKHLIDLQISGGTDALVIAGSTGESTALELEEFLQLIETAVSHAAGRIRIIAGAGAPSTQKSIQMCKLAASAGASAVLIVTPAYCRPTQEGLFQHFQAIAKASRVPVILYNVPGRTAVDLLPATVARLATHPNICGIKEALNDMQRLRELIALQGAKFVVLSGDDPTAVEAIALGVRGLISVAANVRPAAMKNMLKLALDGQLASARRTSAAFDALFDALGVEPNPIPVKWALHHEGHCQALLRLPLTELSLAHQTAVKASLENFSSALANAA